MSTAGELDERLRQAVTEVEHHVAEAGWDQPGRLFALVPTAELLEAEPQLAAQLGLGAGDAVPAGLTPVEQEVDAGPGSLEALLPRIGWPESVVGTIAVVERVVLPPEAEDAVPDDADEAVTYAANHPDREDVRIVVGVLRGGETHCVLRLRSHDDEQQLVHGPDLVPSLLSALRGTLDEASGSTTPHHGEDGDHG